jgi:hypothetical protein
MPTSSRGTPGGRHARQGREAPRSGRQGGLPDGPVRVRAGRPGDATVVAREHAEEAA